MKLTFDEMKALTFGAVFSEQTEEEIRFYRCTKEQIAVYEEKNEKLAEGAKGSNGIHLDFHTDATRVILTVNGGGKYEIHVNGMLAEQYICSDVQTFSVDLPQNEEFHRVTIYLPSHGRGGILRALELEEATRVEKHRYDCKMLFLGDSITQGWNSQFDTLSFAYRTANFFHAEALIQGIGGTRFFPETVLPLPFDPDYVFVALGTNDFDSLKRREDPVGDFRLIVSDYLDKIQALYKSKTVFVISPIPRLMHHEEMIELFKQMRMTLLDEAGVRGFVPIDGYRLMPMSIPLFADQSLHPNDNGFSVYAENLIRLILPYVK